MIAQDETAAEDLVTLQAFASNHDVAIHRYLSRIDTLAQTDNGHQTGNGHQSKNGKAVDGVSSPLPETRRALDTR
ncbi:MAG: hypothetical protein ACLQU2_31390 [Candidatus Binataceae bacterium]